jgi:hypothetical protein
MSAFPFKNVRCVLLLSTILLATRGSLGAHESPIDHIDWTISVGLVKRDLVIDYRMRMTPRAALLQLRAMDRNDDGLVNDEERSAYMGSIASQIRNRMILAVGEERLHVVERAPALMHPDLSNEFRFAARLVGIALGKHVVKLEDDYTRQYPGGVRIRALQASDSNAEPVSVRWAEEPLKGHIEGPLTLLVEMALVEPVAGPRGEMEP